MQTPILAENLIQELRNAGCRITRARLAVVAVLAQSARPLRPMEIVVQARAIHPFVNLATVYRTLEVLQAAHCASRVRLGSEAPVVVACHQTTWHAHLICSRCRQVQERDFGALTKQLEKAVQSAGFVPKSTVVELVGLCRDCHRL